MLLFRPSGVSGLTAAQIPHVTVEASEETLVLATESAINLMRAVLENVRFVGCLLALSPPLLSLNLPYFLCLLFIRLRLHHSFPLA